ncbi:MAG TPA: hypothetical protein VEW72_00380 [Burkholderiales bacterium]|jgi:hypothetical protein|nr:hypothetical protein [Burkholderiales bacterium]
MTLGQRLWTSKGVRIGLLMLAIGVVPLLLYLTFGPKDGNPIGLGLLFIVTAPIGVLMILLNTALAFIQHARED